jgi:hypothetical protein
MFAARRSPGGKGTCPTCSSGMISKCGPRVLHHWAVLTRLAFARLLARDGRPTPVILDDALVYSDDDRIERMFDALHRQSHDQQILVFSCRQRAFAKLGGNILQMSDWQPSRS